MDLAKDAALNFVDVVLNMSGNRIGLVSYDSSVDGTESVTDVQVNLQSEINSYSANGGTCICCGINNAKNMLVSSANQKYMVVMTDGEANYYCSDFDDYTGSNGGAALARQSAIDSGQYACDLGITVFTIGFGENADHDTLKQVACNESLYYNASSVSNITEIYGAIGEQIMVLANFSSQVLTIEGNFQESILYSDSYIRFNYTPVVEPPVFGEIEFVVESDKFTSCLNNITIPDKVRIIDAKALSYSGSHWTSYLNVNSNDIFNIINYGNDYSTIGDPFVIQVPANMIVNGTNEISLNTADDPVNNTGCSNNNTFIYTGAIRSFSFYSDVLENSEGCEWFIETEFSGIINLTVPINYSGIKSCSYTNALISYDDTDSVDVSVYDLLFNLDFDEDGIIDLDITQEDLTIESSFISQLPFLWGPAIFEVRTWG